MSLSRKMGTRSGYKFTTTITENGAYLGSEQGASVNHYTGYFCRVYKCEKKAECDGYCLEHKSDLRTGKAPFTPGSAPVRFRKLDQ